MIYSPQQTKRRAYLLERSSQPTERSEMGLLDWVVRHRPQLKEGALFDLKEHRYLVELYKNQAQRVCYKKASQIGISELMVSYAFHMCDIRLGDVMYVMPTTDDVSDFSSTRFTPALQASPYLAGLIQNDTNKKGNYSRSFDRVKLKQIRNNFLYFRGGTVSRTGKARQLKSVPADAIILDELDEMNPGVRHISEKRLGHSPYKEMRYVSTPTYPGVGIDEVWDESSQAEWFIKCACGQWQTVTINHIVTKWNDREWPVSWHGQDEDRAYAACVKCNRELNHAGMGSWVHRFIDAPIVGYHPTKLMTNFTPLIDIVKSFLTSDETARREAVNQHLGLTFTPKGGQLTPAHLDACQDAYALGPRPRSKTVMGVDVGKVLNVVIRTKAKTGGVSRLVYAGKVQWDDLDLLVKRFKVGMCVMDALPESTKAREFQAGQPDGKVWLCYYGEGEKGSKKNDPLVWNQKEGVVIADRTRLLDITLSRFYDQVYLIPDGAKSIIESYYAQMCTSTRIIEEKKDGTSVSKYINNGADHYLHAENYATMASEKELWWMW